MENQFVKQYPELMRDKKLMYVHGFGSSAQSGTVQMLRTLMPNATVVARDIPLHPEEGLQMLKAMAAEEQPDLIIGTSMGGMYTEMLTGFDRILVNPAFEMGDTMSKFTGKQVFQNPREDGVQEFIVTKGLIKEYQEMTTHNFEHAADPDERTRVVGLFGDKDPVVHTYDLFHDSWGTIDEMRAHRVGVALSNAPKYVASRTLTDAVVTAPRTTIPIEQGIPGAKGLLWDDVAHVVAGKEQKIRFANTLFDWLG